MSSGRKNLARFLVCTGIFLIVRAAFADEPAVPGIPVPGIPVPGIPVPGIPTAREMADSRQDVWGDAARNAPDGPSFDFFRDLLPPLRYVNTDFRHYPIVLCAPAAPVKARWISNGSAVNAIANKKPMWREAGIPVHFSVGSGNEPFGSDLRRLNGPRYLDGFLPIVQAEYGAGNVVYHQEVFAPVRDELAEGGTVWIQFTVQGGAGQVTAKFLDDSIQHAENRILNAQGKLVAWADSQWTWQKDSSSFTASLGSDDSALLAVATLPLSRDSVKLDATSHGADRLACQERWRSILARGAKVDIPEPLVQDAWRSLVVGNYLIAVGNRMHYSAGNAYDHLYEGECGDAVRSLMLFGQLDDTRSMVGPLLDFQRQATRFHVAGHKLQLLTHYYWVTRDVQYVREKQDVWQPVIDFVLASRQADNGLLPPDNYAGDISQQVYSLNSNANCWRGLRDMAAVMDDLGVKEQAAHLFAKAADYRQAILDAVTKSERLDTMPPFIPNALFGAEPVPDPLTATRLGSYYDLISPYIIGSGVFGVDSERETWLMEYLRQHGGLAMGMIRSTPHQGEFDGEPGVNVLYGLRYQLAALRRNERDHVIAGFYGHLAQAMTRNTFIGGEGSRFFHGDAEGRSFYLPPNSAANAAFLTTLRYLIIEDWDLNDDGRPDTLRLLHGAPANWFRDGARIQIQAAPTLFGEISIDVQSRLSRGEIVVNIVPPPHPVGRFLVRPPVPRGWKIHSARTTSDELVVARDGSVDVTNLDGAMELRFEVRRVE